MTVFSKKEEDSEALLDSKLIGQVLFRNFVAFPKLLVTAFF